ncbi:MAG TPA: hypothetical protein EYN67_03960 [Flavobacteriales bacterium]|nr:hypothetical protein [Flavobacteriales bacterium]
MRNVIELGSGLSYCDGGSCPPMLYVVSDSGDLVAYHFAMEKTKWPSIVRGISSKMVRDGVHPVGCFFICETYILDCSESDDWYGKAAMAWAMEHGPLKGSAFDHLLKEYLCSYTVSEAGDAYLQKSEIDVDNENDRRLFGEITCIKLEHTDGNIPKTLMQLFVGGEAIDE